MWDNFMWIKLCPIRHKWKLTERDESVSNTTQNRERTPDKNQSTKGTYIYHWNSYGQSDIDFVFWAYEQELVVSHGQPILKWQDI